MTDTICLDSFEEAEADCAVPLEVEVRVPNEHGGHWIRRKRWKTFNEVYRSMSASLNVLKCENCGKEFQCPATSWWNHEDELPKCCEKRDLFHLVDEYDSCGKYGDDGDTEIAKPEEFQQDIVCYAHVGGNEGYYATLGMFVRENFKKGSRYVHLYHIKSFRGMAHVHDLVKRMMQATGVWPHWIGDQ